MTITQDQRLALLTCMLRMRRFEETVIHLALAHEYIGRQHLHIGHETTGGAVAAILKAGDKLHTTHRNHGFVIAAGADPGEAYAEIMGRAGGLNGGKGGTWHLCNPSHGVSSTSAMVGGSTQIGLAIGSAFAMKSQKTDNVAIAHFGDGTLDEGIAYEALNMASIFELPVLFLCRQLEGRAAPVVDAGRQGASPRPRGAVDPVGAGRRRFRGDGSGRAGCGGEDQGG